MPSIGSREAQRQYLEAVKAAREKQKAAKKAKPKKLRFKRNGIPKFSPGVTWDRWYAAYLRSRHWRRLRAAKLSQAGNRCEVCSSVVGLAVHHVTYANLRREELADLRVLCHDCHDGEHGYQTSLDAEFLSIVGCF